jgi:hypothetical protein
VWKTSELKDGYALFTRPGRVRQEFGFRMTVDEDGVAYGAYR